MKRILVISWFFPPVNSSEGLVTYKLLRKSKYEYDVFTQKKVDLWSYGNKDYLPEAENVKSILSNADNLKDWETDAVEYYKKNINKYDIVMTRSMPPESHKIGLEIKKINPKVKWIASFGDPIADNPYTELKIREGAYNPFALRNYYRLKLRNVISPRRIYKNILFKIRYKKFHYRSFHNEEVLQKKILNAADYYIFNSCYQRDFMLGEDRKKYKGESIIINHSFAEDLYPLKQKKEHGKLIMTYVGHLDDLRSPRLLFKALSELLKEDSNLNEKIEVRFYGNMDSKDKVYVIDNELTDIVKVKKSVSYLESLKIMQESDWVIHFDANLTSVLDTNIFFAAKLADYIGSKSQIFAITMQNGISADILQNMNSLMVTYSVQEIKNYLWLMIYQNYKSEINEEYRNNFNSEYVAKSFDNTIDRILK